MKFFIPFMSLMLLPAVAVAGGTGAMIGSSNDISSGEAGARAGTAVYNSINPNNPLPNSSGNVVPDTVKNLGSGQSAKDAWSKAAKDNAGSK